MYQDKKPRASSYRATSFGQSGFELSGHGLRRLKIALCAYDRQPIARSPLPEAHTYQI